MFVFRKGLVTNLVIPLVFSLRTPVLSRRVVCRLNLVGARPFLRVKKHGLLTRVTLGSTLFTLRTNPTLLSVAVVRAELRQLP